MNKPSWAEMPEVLEWKNQGRTEEQIYGVTNFLTGAGGKMIERLIAEALQAERKRIADAISKLNWEAFFTPEVLINVLKIINHE